MVNKLYFVVGVIAALSASFSEGHPTEENRDVHVSSPRSHGYSPRPYDCNRALVSIHEYRWRCVQNAVYLQVKPHLKPGETWTTTQILNYLKDFCKRAKPVALDCILQRAINCSAEYKQGLLQGGQAGLLCESGNTGNVHPSIEYLFDRLGAEEVTEFQNNPDCQLSRDVVTNPCIRQALQTPLFDWGSSEGTKFLEALPLPELFQYGERVYFKPVTECMVRRMPSQFANRSSTCNWKVSAVLAIIDDAFPPMLGVNFPFTHGELDELFQFGHRNNV